MINLKRKYFVMLYQECSKTGDIGVIPHTNSQRTCWIYKNCAVRSADWYNRTIPNIERTQVIDIHTQEAVWDSEYDNADHLTKLNKNE
jgi:hypothetical protein